MTNVKKTQVTNLKVQSWLHYKYLSLGSQFELISPAALDKPLPQVLFQLFFLSALDQLGVNGSPQFWVAAPRHDDQSSCPVRVKTDPRLLRTRQER